MNTLIGFLLIAGFFAPQATLSATKRLAIENFSLPSNSKLNSNIVTEEFKEIAKKDPGEYQIVLSTSEIKATRVRLGEQLLTSDAETSDADKVILPPSPDSGIVIADFLLQPSIMQEENGEFTVQATIYNMTSYENFSVKQSGSNRNQALRCLWQAIRSYPKQPDECAFELEMVDIPSGFVELGITFDNQQKNVSVTAFKLGKYPITQKQWEMVMGTSGFESGSCPNCPVNNVTMERANEYLLRLNERTGKIYRLPKYAEWWHACKAADEFGLRDMGIVSEKCQSYRDIKDDAQMSFEKCTSGDIDKLCNTENGGSCSQDSQKGNNVCIADRTSRCDQYSGLRLAQ